MGYTIKIVRELNIPVIIQYQSQTPDAKKNICPLYAQECEVHPKTLFEIAMVLSTNSGSFPSNSHVSATFSILLRFGESWNPTNCEKFNADGSQMGRTNLDKSVW